MLDQAKALVVSHPFLILTAMVIGLFLSWLIVEIVKDAKALRKIEQLFSAPLHYQGLLKQAPLGGLVVKADLGRVSERYYPGDAAKKATLTVHGWKTAYDRIIAENDYIDLVDRGRLELLGYEMGIPPRDPTFQKGLHRLNLCAFLDQMDHGPVVPKELDSYYTGTGRQADADVWRLKDHMPKDLPVRIKQGENIAWAWKNVGLGQDMVYREYHGDWKSVSVPIGKRTGIRFHAGRKHGVSVPRMQRVQVDSGAFAITDKAIYYGGAHKAFRIPHDKIVSVEEMSDGITILKDSSSSAATKPWALYLPDAWFAYRLLMHFAPSENNYLSQDENSPRGPTQDFPSDEPELNETIKEAPRAVMVDPDEAMLRSLTERDGNYEDETQPPPRNEDKVNGAEEGTAYKAGDPVQVALPEKNGKTAWYNGQVLRVLKNRKYRIKMETGEELSRVEEDCLKPAKRDLHRVENSEPKFEIGDRVKVMFGEEWYAGEVRQMYNNDRYKVEFDDGDTFNDIRKDEMKPLAE
ncbi:tudor domain-containing protein [Methylocapsa acidiphila]|uniref:tudor domain-containing protein n=1 Tax=Methylocapsa acidiphila TaxID=133552 RepID=UPI000414FC59|nr:tudor domain-containing protein [Methylocapsa acidiphila]